MKGRVQKIYRDQDRDLGNGDQRRKNTVSKKGNIQGYMEIGDGVRTRMRARTRARWGQGQGQGQGQGGVKDENEDGAKTRTIE